MQARGFSARNASEYEGQRCEVWTKRKPQNSLTTAGIWIHNLRVSEKKTSQESEEEIPLTD